MIILGIETSCDETASALIEIKNNKVKVLSNIVSSQVKIHQKYGGIVPEVAARNHVADILPVVKKALEPLRNPRDLTCLAVTVGPGLITSLIVGVETAKTLAATWQKPIVAVNHLEGHIYANFITYKLQLITNNSRLETIKFPALALIVSGGHTELILMKNHGKYKIVGQTLDDAAGEAFDKIAKILGLGYPGGPAISKLATKGDSTKINLPRPMIHSKNFNFSFSGLKTAALYKAQSSKLKTQSYFANMSASVEQAIVDVLIAKTIKAAQKYKVKTIMLSGGVAANNQLRLQLDKAIENKIPNTKYLIPDTSLCTDNALMIALSGYFNAKQKNFTPWHKLKVDPNLRLA